ncbi:MAG: hypothetical protein HY982_02700 [Candidatus Magasanikbacteria bacterium]|nr:hypothetical protein [Candidatus Magasanikbacteria bacterium]
MNLKPTQKMSFAEFGDFLQNEWEQGNIGSEVHDWIEAGIIPIPYFREKYHLIIEREGDGVRLTKEDGYGQIRNLRHNSAANDNDEMDGLRRAA